MPKLCSMQPKCQSFARCRNRCFLKDRRLKDGEPWKRHRCKSYYNKDAPSEAPSPALTFGVLRGRCKSYYNKENTPPGPCALSKLKGKTIKVQSKFAYEFTIGIGVASSVHDGITFGNFTKADGMTESYSDGSGLYCSGKKRSVKVTYQEGSQNRIISDKEPSKCYYEFMIEFDSAICKAPGSMVRDPQSDGRKCNNGKGRLFKLRRGEATQQACEEKCKNDEACQGYSAIFGRYCMGCSGALEGQWRRSIAFTKLGKKEVTCSCTTPNAGTAGKNQFKCTNGETRYCSATQKCNSVSAWPEADVSSVCVEAKKEPEIKILCDWDCYLERYPDLRDLVGTSSKKLEEHYNAQGKKEGRDCTCRGTGAPSLAPSPSPTPVPTPPPTTTKTTTVSTITTSTTSTRTIVTTTTTATSTITNTSTTTTTTSTASTSTTTFTTTLFEWCDVYVGVSLEHVKPVDAGSMIVDGEALTIHGGGLASNSDTESHCCYLCSKIEECTGFTWVAKNCYLKKGITKFVLSDEPFTYSGIPHEKVTTTTTTITTITTTSITTTTSTISTTTTTSSTSTTSTFSTVTYTVTTLTRTSSTTTNSTTSSTTTYTTTTSTLTTTWGVFNFLRRGKMKEAHWIGLKTGADTCYQAVSMDSLCRKDEFAFIERGNKNCGCNSIHNAHTGYFHDDDSDVYKINEVYSPARTTTQQSEIVETTYAIPLAIHDSWQPLDDKQKNATISDPIAGAPERSKTGT
eukprot:TRINITY_DN4887_c0_g1_i10.p1 TRINITY_DN4887_c0_g1~~TRINITY_DN4887_c0_g1_i10.p1  ORF type:complete len:741 (+),score=51.09 TRINITY_DN4887_c0_g1_i10:468-2690(+)